MSESEDDKKFHSWLVYGVTKGWISLPVCATHNPLPTMRKRMSNWLSLVKAIWKT